MATLTILNYPDPRLHTVAKPVLEVNATIQRIVNDMAETMYAAPGVGLAATQVNQHIQFVFWYYHPSYIDFLFDTFYLIFLLVDIYHFHLLIAWLYFLI